QGPQVVTSGFVDDLASALLGDSLADDHQPSQSLSSPCFRHTAITIEQQESIKLVLELLFGTSHRADDQRMLVAKDNTRETLARATQQQRIADRTISHQPLRFAQMPRQDQPGAPT